MRSFCARSVGVVDGGDDEGDGDDASPCLTSLSLMLSTLPPLPSSWQKEGRRLAFLSTNLIDHVDTVDGGEGGGGEHGADAVPTLPAARETWYAAALALERAFAAGPRWRRRRRWRQLLAPGWPGAEVEEGEEDQAVGRTRRGGGAPGQAADGRPSWMSRLALSSPPSVEVVRSACPPAFHTRQ